MQGKDGKVRAEDLSVDQKPDTPSEKRRIEAAGGVISKPKLEGYPAVREGTPALTACENGATVRINP